MVNIKSKKKFFLFLLVVTFFIILFEISSTSAWLTGYDYRKQINLTGGTNAGNDYQIKLTIGNTSGGDFNLGGNATNFPNDIRFTDDDGETLLPYWIENTTSPAIFWVKVNDSLNSNQIIYIYYGNSTVSSATNGTATFVMFDDFESTALNAVPDSSKWVITGTDANDNVTIYLDPANASNQVARTIEQIDGVGTRLWVKNLTSSNYSFDFDYRTSVNRVYYFYIYDGATIRTTMNLDTTFHWYNGAAYQNFAPATPSHSTNTWYDTEIFVAGPFLNMTINGVNYKGGVRSNATASVTSLVMNPHTASLTPPLYQYVDDFRVRKFSMNPPVLSAVGGQELIQGLTCGNLSDGTYTLTQNVTSNTTCFITNSTNVILDCQGFYIYGNNSPSSYGVYSNYPNTTVKNCNIFNYSSGIILDSNANSTLENNTINVTFSSGSDDYGIKLGSGVNSTTKNNIINGSGTNIYAYMSYAINSSSINDTIFVPSGRASFYSVGTTMNQVFNFTKLNGKGVIFYQGNPSFYNLKMNTTSGSSMDLPRNITLKNITINTNGDADAVTISGVGVHLDCENGVINGSNIASRSGVYSSVGNAKIKNCNINNFNYCIRIYGGMNNSVENIIATTSYNGGIPLNIYFQSNYTLVNNFTGSALVNGFGLSIQYSSHNVINNSNFNSLGGRGIYFYGLIGTGLTLNNTLNNSSGNSSSNYGIQLSSSNDNLIYNSNGSSNTLTGIDLTDSSNNYFNNIIGNLTNNPTSTGDGITLESNSINNTFENSFAISNSQKVDSYNSAFRIFYSNNNTLNNVTANVTGINATGISLYSSNYTLINGSVGDSNNFNNSGSGMLLSNSSHNVLNNSVAISGLGNGALGLNTNSNYNNIVNFIGIANSTEYGCKSVEPKLTNNVAIFITTSSSYNNLTNVSGYSRSEDGIAFYNNSANNIVNNSLGLTYSSVGILLTNWASDNQVINSTAIAMGGSCGGGKAFGIADNSSRNNITNITAIQYGAVSTDGAFFIRCIGATAECHPNFNNTVINSKILIYNSTNGISITDNSTGNVIRNISINSTYTSSTLSLLKVNSSNNVFCLNNFTSNLGIYINDSNGSNTYNCSYGGKVQGNIYENVNNGTINVLGSENSSIANYYIGKYGSGYPYNQTNSLNKIYGAVDYVPLTIYLTSCAYSGSGNWVINCSENCTILSNTDVVENNISILGVGTFRTSANITGFSKLIIAGIDSSNICRVTCFDGGCFKD
ncbi:MAG: DUF2341 domain-containing protein [Candidatus Pacearchaeota archaeon]|jgi:hypothetical protein